MNQFIGRKRELEILKGLTHKRSASMVVIRGRRRIGKSRLIQEFCKPYESFIFSGVPPTDSTTKQSEIDEFAKQLQHNFKTPNMAFQDWNDVFWYLAAQIKQGRKIIVFDEISWMGTKDPDFLGKLKNAWDLHFKKNDKLMLILCGSVSAWMERNILRSTGFVGRISSTITLGELSLEESAQFWGQHADQISAHEKFKVLSVTGGIPRYLEEIRPELTAEQNLTRICFKKEGFLFQEFDQIFSDVFLTRSEFYRQALEIIVSNKLNGAEICKRLNLEINNKISDYFEELQQAGFVSRDYTWHVGNKEASKLSHYRIKDNYTRFYLKYILPNKQVIEQGLFDYRSLSSLPDWNTIMGLQFENLVLNNRLRIIELLQINKEEILWNNPYFQNATTKHQGCQIDYLIQTKFNTLYVCEIKFSAHEIKSNVIEEVKEKIHRLARPKGVSVRPVLVHVNGVSEEVLDEAYFAHIVNFSDFLSSS